MTRIKIAILAFIVVMVVLGGMFGCEPSREPVNPTTDREGHPVPVTVYFYDSAREVTIKYREIHGIARSEKIATRHGFAIWPEWRDTQTGEALEFPDQYECEIHTVRPTRVDDIATLTLGHEVLHCIYGSYHRNHGH